jgi:hypothetical protein
MKGAHSHQDSFYIVIINLIHQKLSMENRYLLYDIQGFSVEVGYHPDKNKIQSLKTFLNVSQLEHYLRKIKLDI